MFKIRNSNKKKLLVLAIILVIIAGGYLNRAYSHIYGVLGAADLRPANGQGTYLIGGTNLIEGVNQINNMATTSLIYVALGDSLTAGVGTDSYQEILPYLLAEKFAAGEKTIVLKNHSVPGAETADVVTDLLSTAINDNPDIVTLLIGVNDIHNKVSAAKFTENYEEILNRLQRGTRAKIYVINLPFLGSDKLMLPPYQSLFDARTREFNEIIKGLADKYSVQYIDLYTPTVELFKRSGDHYSKDLFHPSAGGYKLWADIIYDRINN
ncbi:MAG: SGNH/GDSL hydrolase family protein [Candidatus Falkowbacteria bacterium]|nr:SGNH/GDSL hydrolase family protein [Candidatus Falkowbacteria bacterium]